MSKPNWPEHHGLVSRRALIRAAGLATGGALLLGLPRFVNRFADEAHAAPLSTTLSSINLTLELDGQPASPLRSAEGGNAVAQTTVDLLPVGNFTQSRLIGFHYEDIRIEAPFGIESPLSKWIDETLAKPPVPKTGAIVYTDSNFNMVKRLEFSGAYITEIVLPTADAIESKAPASVLLRIAPHSTFLVGGTGQPYQLSLATTSKAILAGLFRLNIQGLEKACGRIRKVEHMSATRSMRSSSDVDRTTKSAVGPFTCSQISIHLPEADGGPFYSWFDATVLKGKPGGERAGLLEWLDPTFKTVLAKVQLGGLGIVRYAPQAVKIGTAEGAPMVQVDMYCETITLTV